MSASDWATLGAAFLGAIVGGGFVIWGTKRTLSSAAEAANEDRAEQRRVADEQYQRELLSRAADRLLDALWAKERELCEVLHQCRVEVEQGIPVTPDDAALKELGRLDLAVYADMISSLPFIHDGDLRKRMRSAAKMVNDCYNIRAGSTPEIAHGGTVAVYERAMIDVQAYFKWLRWNLTAALQGDELPPPVDMPNVRRPEAVPAWSPPHGVPQWT